MYREILSPEDLKQGEEKYAAANAILQSCLGPMGVWADPTRYRHQCWTRDLSLAIAPLLMDQGYQPVVLRHLMNLAARQRENGQIPILFLDNDWEFLKAKLWRSLKSRSVSFMLKRYLTGNLWNLTPGTRDSELLYMLATLEFENKMADRGVHLSIFNVEIFNKAIRYLQENLINDGLMVGCDWRDTMEKELGHLPLLTNNALLYGVYRLLNDEKRMHALANRVDEVFWKNGHYIDYPGRDRFDPLGGSFAVLHGLAPKARYTSILGSFLSVDTQNGVTIKCKHNPLDDEEAEVIERTDGVVVWPFVVGFSILALIEMKEYKVATDQMRKMIQLEGFREWYDPSTGKGYGAFEQLWSATLFMRAWDAWKKFE